MNALYEISAEQDDLIIRLPRKSTDEQTLTKLLDFLTLEAIRRQSQLSEEDLAELTKEVKHGAWQLVKHLFTEQ